VTLFSSSSGRFTIPARTAELLLAFRARIAWAVTVTVGLVLVYFTPG